MILERGGNPQFSLTVVDPCELSKETVAVESAYRCNTSISPAAIIGNHVSLGKLKLPPNPDPGKTFMREET